MIFCAHGNGATICDPAQEADASPAGGGDLLHGLGWALWPGGLSAEGPFWGFQEAWLSLAASIFDMALYPTLFVLYLGRVWPRMSGGHVALAVGVAVIAVCVLWNLRGARSVGHGSVVVGVLLLAPFGVMVVEALVKSRGPSPATAAPHLPLVMGVLVVMWNYMGWDNASTIAGEVENPQRTYPLGMLLAVAAVATSYIVVVAAAWRTGIAPAAWDTGAWVQVAVAVGGRGLGLAVVAGGMLCGLGMMNALVLSYSRVPMAMALEGMLPRVLTRIDTRTSAPGSRSWRARWPGRSRWAWDSSGWSNSTSCWPD
jgi:amino acid transporter